MADIRVLIVDDDERQRDGLARWLRIQEKISADTAATGEEALALIHEAGGEYDVVLMDEVLPGIDGTETMCRIKEEFPRIQVIMFTGLDPEAGVKALRLGAYRYIIKPIRNEELAILLRHVDEIRQLERRLLMEGELVKATRRIAEHTVSVSKEQLLYEIAQAGSDLLGVPVCIIWELDKNDGLLKVAAWAGDVDEAYRKNVHIDSQSKATRTFLEKKQPLALENLQDSRLYKHKKQARERGWVSLLTAPMIAQNRIVGILDAYTHRERRFGTWEIDLLATFAAQAAVAIRQASLSEHSQEVSRLALTGSYEELADYVVEAVSELTGTAVTLWMLDEKARVLRIQASYGLREGRDEEAVLPLEAETITALALRTRQPVFRRDILDETEEPRFYHMEEARRQGWRSFLSVPLLGQREQPLGTLSIYGPEPRDFSEAEQALLSTFANQAAIAIENSRLFHALQEGTRTLSALHQAGQSLTTAPDLDAVLTGVVEGAQTILKADAVVLYQYYSGEDRVLIPPIFRGVRDTEHLHKTDEFHEESVVYQIIRSSKVRYAPRAGEDEILSSPSRPRHAVPAFVRREKIVSSAGIPLEAMGEIVGVLFVNYRSFHDFDEQEQDEIELFASQAAVAIQNARRLQQERVLRHRAETLRGVSDAIDADLELRTVGERILDALNEVIEYRKASLQLVRGDNRTLLAGRGFETRTASLRFLHPISRDPLISRVVTAMEPLILSDVTKDPDWVEHAGTADVRSWVGLPLIHGQELFGIVTLDHDQPGFYTEDHKDALASFMEQAGVDIRDAFFLDSVQRRIRDMEIVQEVVQIIGAKLDTESLLNTIVSQIATRLNCVHCTIFVPQEKGGETWLVARESYGLESERAKERRFKPGEGLTGWVFKHGKSLVLDNALEDERFAPARYRKGEPRSMIVAPVKVGDQTIGVICADQVAHGWFSESDLRLVDALAQQAGIAIQRARGLQLLQEIGSLILGTEDETEILPQIVTGAIELANTSSGVIYLLDEDGRSIVKRYYYPEDFDTPPPRIKEGQGLTHEIIHTREPIVIPDIYLDKRVNFKLRDFGVRSLMGFPLRLGDKVIGVLYLNDKQIHCPTEVERSLLLTLVSQAAIAIEKARLFDQAQDRIRYLEISSKIGEVIRTKLDIDSLLQAIVTQIAEQLDCTHCTIFFPQEEEGERLLVPQKTHGVRPEIMNRRFKPDEGLAGWVFQHGESLVLANAREDSRFAKEREVQAESRSMLVAPVKVGDQTIGVISADQDAYGWFGESDRRWVDALAQQIGVAVQRSTGLKLLQEVGNQIISAPNVDAILQRVVAGAIELTHTTSGVIYLLSEDRESVIGTFQYPPEFDHPAPRLDKEDSFTRRVIANGKALFVSDIGQSDLVNPVLRDRVHSMIAVPLKLEEQVVGVLYLNDEHTHDFTEIEVSLLSTLASQAAAVIQNARLREAQIAAIGQISSSIASPSELQPVLDGILNSTIALMGEANLGEIRLLDREANELVVAASHGEAIGEQHRRVRVGKGITGWVAENKEPQNVPDVRKDKRYLAFLAGTLSELAVPMLRGDELLGVLNIEHPRVNAFTEDDVKLASAMANLAVVAIENTRLVQELEERARRLLQLQEVTTVISAEPSNLGEVLQVIVRGLQDIFQGASCAIRLYDLEKDVFGSRVAVGVWKDQVDHLPRPDGTSQYVIQTKEPFYIEDTSSTPLGGPGIRQEVMAQGVKSAAYLPLLIEEGVIGILYVDLTEPRQFSSYDRQILELFASQAAVAIENARLYQGLERRIEELRVLTEIGRTVSNLGIDQILDLVYEQAGKIMDLSNAQVQIAFYDEAKDEVSFPLAVEQDNGEIIDIVRWSEREVPFREGNEDSVVKQFLPRIRRDPPGLTEYVIRAGQPLLIAEDFEEEATALRIRVWPTFGRLARPTHSWLGVPMMVAGRVTGVISIQSLEVECAFDQGHVELLSTVASQAAVAIENAQMYNQLDERVKERTQQLANLLEVSTKITSQLVELEEVLGTIIESAIAVTSADSSTLFLYDPEQEKFVRGIRRGKITPELAIPASTGLSAHIAMDSEDVFCQCAESEGLLSPEFLNATGIKSFAGIPLRFGERTVGVLYLNFSKPHEFSSKEREAIRLFANQAAVAIENARLYAQLDKERLELRARLINAERLLIESRFATSYIHRVNNLVGTIPIRVGQIREKLKGNDTREVLQMLEPYLSGINNDATQVNPVIDELIEITRQGTKEEIVDVVNALKRVARRVRIETPAEIYLEEDYPEESIKVRAIAWELSDAFWNILKNGAEAMLPKGGGLLAISVSKVPGEAGNMEAEVRVHNEGHIPESMLKQIFEPFYSTKEGGTGYGLWRTKLFVQELGGRISIDNADDGVNAIIHLPIADEDGGDRCEEV